MDYREKIDALREALKATPDAYPESYNYVPGSAHRKGFLDELLDYVLSDDDMTTAKASMKYYELMGSPGPLRVIDIL